MIHAGWKFCELKPTQLQVVKFGCRGLIYVFQEVSLGFCEDFLLPLQLRKIGQAE